MHELMTRCFPRDTAQYWSYSLPTVEAQEASDCLKQTFFTYLTFTINIANTATCFDPKPSEVSVSPTHRFDSMLTFAFVLPAT